MDEAKTIKLTSILRGSNAMKPKPKSSNGGLAGTSSEKTVGMSERKRRLGFLSLGKPTASGVKKLVDKL